MVWGPVNLFAGLPFFVYYCTTKQYKQLTMTQPATFGAKMFGRFIKKGWHISFTDKYQDRVCVIPPERLDAQHVFGIYIPVLRHTWQPDLQREWWAALQTKDCMLGPKFEATAHPDDIERFAAFAAWIGDLLRNPEKFL